MTTVAAPETTAAEPDNRVTVVAERPCYVTVYEGEGTKGRVLFSDLLDPDTKLAQVKLPRVEGGYTFELGNAGGVVVRRPRPPPVLARQHQRLLARSGHREGQADRVTQVRAAVLVTGSEILIGRTVDTNSSYLARQLDDYGVRLERIVAVDDREDEIVAALPALLQSGVDLVLTSGGLGPTHDDRTVACVARVAGVELVLDEATLAQIDAMVAEFSRAAGRRPDGLRARQPQAGHRARRRRGARARRHRARA